MVQEDLFGREVTLLVRVQVSPDDPDFDVDPKEAAALAQARVDQALTNSAIEDRDSTDLVSVQFGDTEILHGDPYRKKPRAKKKKAEKASGGVDIDIDIGETEIDVDDLKKYVDRTQFLLKERKETIWLLLFMLAWVVYWLGFKL